MGVRSAIEVIAGEWARGFGAQELDAVAQLYTDNAVYIGPSGMRRGRDGILEYLKANWTNAVIEFHDLSVELLGRDVALASLKGAACYDDGPARGFRFLQTYVWTPKGWRIAGHHGSFEPEAV